MLTYILEVTLCWTTLYVIFFALLRKVTFYRVNRWYLLTSLVLGIIIPLLRFIEIDVYQEEVAEIAPLIYVVKEAPSQLAYAVIEQTTDWASIIATCFKWFYFFGLTVFLFRFLKGIYTIKKLYSSGSRVKKPNFTLIETKEDHLPFSFFNYVFVSNTLQLQDDIKDILRHELAHVKSRHSLDVIFVELVNISFWFHPMVYLYKTALRQTHEYLADEVVLQDTPRQLYGQILLKQSLSGIQVALAHHFFHSHIKKRITMMYQKKSGQSAWLKYSLALPVLILLFVIFSGYHTQQPYTTEELKEDMAKCQNSIACSYGPAYFHVAPLPLGEKSTCGYDFLLTEQFKYVINHYDISSNFIIVIDDQIIDSDLNKYLNATDGFAASSITILAPEEAIKKFGEQGRFGSLEITDIFQSADHSDHFIGILKEHREELTKIITKFRHSKVQLEKEIIKYHNRLRDQDSANDVLIKRMFSDHLLANNYTYEFDNYDLLSVQAQFRNSHSYGLRTGAFVNQTIDISRQIRASNPADHNIIISINEILLVENVDYIIDLDHNTLKIMNAELLKDNSTINIEFIKKESTITSKKANASQKVITVSTYDPRDFQLVVEANNKILKEDYDYKVERHAGKLVVLNDDVLAEGHPIVVSFKEKAQLSDIPLSLYNGEVKTFNSRKEEEEYQKRLNGLEIINGHLGYQKFGEVALNRNNVFNHFESPHYTLRTNDKEVIIYEDSERGWMVKYTSSQNGDVTVALVNEKNKEVAQKNLFKSKKTLEVALSSFDIPLKTYQVQIEQERNRLDCGIINFSSPKKREALLNKVLSQNNNSKHSTSDNPIRKIGGQLTLFEGKYIPLSNADLFRKKAEYNGIQIFQEKQNIDRFKVKGPRPYLSRSKEFDSYFKKGKYTVIYNHFHSPALEEVEADVYHIKLWDIKDDEIKIEYYSDKSETVNLIISPNVGKQNTIESIRKEKGLHQFTLPIREIPKTGFVISLYPEWYGGGFDSHIYRINDSKLVSDKVARDQWYGKSNQSIENATPLSNETLIDMGATDIPRGSVIVKVGNELLLEHKDYSIDYENGLLTIMDERYLRDKASINVSFLGKDLNNQLGQSNAKEDTIQHLYFDPRSKTVTKSLVFPSGTTPSATDTITTTQTFDEYNTSLNPEQKVRSALTSTVLSHRTNTSEKNEYYNNNVNIHLRSFLTDDRVIEIEYQSPYEEDVTYYLHDLLGKLIQKQTLPHNDGQSNVYFTLSQETTSIIIINTEQGGRITSQKLLIP